VALPVVRTFVARVKDRQGGRGLRCAEPGPAGRQIVNEELVAILGGETRRLNLAKQSPSVIMLAGLQGSGKTTLAGKLAKWLTGQGHTRCWWRVTCSGPTRSPAADRRRAGRRHHVCAGAGQWRRRPCPGSAAWRPNSPATDITTSRRGGHPPPRPSYLDRVADAIARLRRNVVAPARSPTICSWVTALGRCRSHATSSGVCPCPSATWPACRRASSCRSPAGRRA